MPARLAELVAAISREQDPAVRGRAAVHLIRDLDAARLAAERALDAAVRELRASGTTERQITELLEVPGTAGSS